VKFLSRLLTRYWGYLALAIAVVGAFDHTFGLSVVLVLSLAALGYFLLDAPVSCCAVIRTGQSCRNNSSGLLLGCSIRQHKWQRFKQALTPAGGRAVLAAGKSVTNSLVLLGGVVSGVVALTEGARMLLH
jgi:hypothetical protein